MTDDLQWKTPAGRQQAGAAHRTAEMLKARPGEWAVIEEYNVPQVPAGADEATKASVATDIRKVRAKASSRASLIKQGRVAAFRSDPNEGVFTAVSRSEAEAGDAKVLRVYAIYLQGEAAADYLRDQEQKRAAKEAAKGAASDGSGEVASAPAPAAAPVEATV